MNGLLMGLIGGGVSGLATTSGAIPVLLKNKRITQFLKNINMDFVTGVMLSAAAFALIWPAYESVYKRQDFCIGRLRKSSGQHETAEESNVVRHRHDGAQLSRRACIWSSNDNS